MYPMAGLRAGGFFYYLTAQFVTALTAQSVGLLLGASVNDDRAIQILAPILFFPVFLFSGPLSVNIPPSLAWLEYAIFYKYSVVLMTSNEFRGLTFTLSSPGSNGTISGEAFLETLGLNDVSQPVAWLVLIAIMLLLRGLALLALTLCLWRRMA